MVTEADVRLLGGRTLHVYDTGASGAADGPDTSVAVFWHHGSPNVGSPPSPARNGNRPRRRPTAENGCDY
jgi:hypothetical protein